MTVKAMLKLSDYEATPYWAWNAFIGLIAMEECKDFTPLQRDAALAFGYDSEVQNGGHLQYFENRGSARAKQAISALDHLGLPCQQQVLSDAVAAWTSQSRPRIRTAEEYSSIALAGEFDLSNRAYHQCAPTIEKRLEEILKTHFGEFIDLTP